MSVADDNELFLNGINVATLDKGRSGLEVSAISMNFTTDHLWNGAR